MEFDEVLKDWNEQNIEPKLNKHEVLQLINRNVRKHTRNNFWLLFISGTIMLLAFLSLLFWVYLFVNIGSGQMREMDIFPPFGWFILFPLYVFAISLHIIIRHISQKKKQREFNQTVNGIFLIRKNQLENRVSFFHKLPFIYLGGLLVTTLGQFITPEFSYFTNYSLPIAFGLFLPDVLLIVVLTVLTRKRIRNKYKPQLSEIEKLLKDINFNDQI
ncbi:hypothetical protein H7U19_12145 [Hyunsoonleella sp. SJ7]|uniref:Uncharacterized protein n=1 Tax=Hyunsoonleella aquatilis TaxID=2762758 RepID=A0A923HC52_9FLAO|nr:hypothetical protein [Hyunsoonleella aquatilis]MBC3759162.1 hypothetical protein [Hyunsoonleella aquatilis]